MNVNKTILAGRITRDPEVRFTPKGTAVTELGLAVNEREKVNDEWVEKPVFIDVTVWGRQAENCGNYLQKGSVVFIEGRLQLDQWEDKETGKKRTKLKVVAQNVQFGPKTGESSEPSIQYKSQQNKQPMTASTADLGDGDEIPF